MRVRWLAGKKAGQIENVRNNDPAVYTMIRAGMAEEVGPDATNEIPGLSASGSSQNVQPPFAATVQWGIKPLSNSFDGKPCVLRQIASEFTWFDGPPKDCPKVIADRYAVELKRWLDTKRANEDVRRQAEEATYASKYGNLPKNVVPVFGAEE